MLAACTLGGCMTQRGIPASGTVVETRVVTTVDTQLAKSYLETSFAQGPRHDQTKAVRALYAKFDQRTMSWELLRDLTHETSVDFATLYFIRRTLMDQRNVQCQRRFAALVRELELDPRSRSVKTSKNAWNSVSSAFYSCQVSTIGPIPRAAPTLQVLAPICATAASTPNWSRLRRTGRSNRMLHLLLRQCARKSPPVSVLL